MAQGKANDGLLYARPKAGGSHNFFLFETRNMSEFLRVMDNTVVLEPTEVLCRTDDRIRLLIAVHSAPGNAEERRVIRQA